MTAPTISRERPTVDILEDVGHVFHSYAPLLHDRSRITVSFDNGTVKAVGYTKTAQSRDIFAREAAKIDGVSAVDVSELYDDDTFRLEAGDLVPFGVYVFVSYGAVVLTGRLPEGTTAEALVAEINKLPGVRKVIPNF